jgi:hypothetical protein
LNSKLNLLDQDILYAIYRCTDSSHPTIITSTKLAAQWGPELPVQIAESCIFTLEGLGLVTYAPKTDFDEPLFGVHLAPGVFRRIQAEEEVYSRPDLYGDPKPNYGSLVPDAWQRIMSREASDDYRLLQQQIAESTLAAECRKRWDAEAAETSDL